MTGDSFFDSVRATGITRPGNTPLVGVCAGLAKRWNVDPLLIRAAIVALTFLGGAGITLYAIGWLLLPDETERIHAQEPFYGKASTSFIIAIIMALTPLLSFGIGPIKTGLIFGPFGFLISLVIVATIVIILQGQTGSMAGQHDRRSTAAGANGHSGAQSAPYSSGMQSSGNPAGAYSSGSSPASSGGSSDGNPGWPGPTSGSASQPEGPFGPDSGTAADDSSSASSSWQGSTASHDGQAGGLGPDPAASSDRPWRAEGEPAQDRSELYATVTEDLDWSDKRPAAGSRAVLLVIAFLLILAAGVAFVLDRGFEPLTDTNLVLGAFAGAAIILGIIVTVYGIIGRRGGGLSALAIIIVAVMFPVAALVALPSAEHHVLMGEKVWTPTSSQEAEGGYSMIMGSIDLDVSELDEAEINVSGRLGEVTIIIGDDQQVAVITDYVLSDVSGTDRGSSSSGVSGDTTHLFGDIETVEEADIVIHVDVIMSDLNIERQS